MTEAEKDRYFRYLDCLRHTGVTNMWGAPAYVEQEFGLSQRVARDVVAEWMRTYTLRHPKS